MALGRSHTDHGRGDVGLSAPTLAGLNERRARRLWLALGLNVGIVALEVLMGVVAGSLGLLADAGHNFSDVVAVVTSLMAVRWAMRRPTDRHSFGYHRGTILAALLNATTILLVTLVIGFEAVRRLMNPEPVSGGYVLVVALIAAGVNAVAALALREPHADHGQRDLNMRSALLHMTSDAVVSVGVAAAGAVILLTGSFEWLDPGVSLVIGLLIAVQAVRLFAQAVSVLLESTPRDIDVDRLSSFMSDVPGVEAVHDVHVWSLSSDVRALSAHLVLAGHPTLEEAQEVGNRIKAAVADQFGIAHATLELECEACSDDGADCAIDGDQPATTSSRHR